MNRIGINRDTYELNGDLEGHSLTRKCEEPDHQLVDQAFLDDLEKYKKEGADIWWYKSDMALCGTSGFAIVLGEYVLRYQPVCIH